MDSQTEDKVAIAVLQTQVISLTNNLTDMMEVLESIKEQLRVFNASIKAGKWVFAAILIALGSLGHKGYEYLVQFVTGN